MRIRAFFLILLPLFACGDENLENTSSSDAVNNFSVNLLQRVLQEKSGNVILSPLSVAVLLAILHQGACCGTKDQLTHTLQAEPEQTRDVYKKLITSLQNVSNGTLLELANGVFLNEGYEVFPEFKNLLTADFLSEIATVNFSENAESAQKINHWVSEHTHHKIKELISADSLSSLTRMVLVNGIYFKDLWQIPFNPQATKRDTFYSDTEKQVSMMYVRDNFRTSFCDDIQAQLLEMPFQGGRFSMLIVLPKERNGLQSMLEKFRAEHLSRFINNKEQTALEVALSLPKFKLSTDVKLIPFLKKLEITDAFNINANFSKISEEPIYVSEVVQKAEIEVDELGATAAAATGAIGATYSLPYPSPFIVFKADHPFLAFIVDNGNGVILFGGRVNDPSEI